MESLRLAAFFIVLAGVLSVELCISASVLELLAGVIAHNLFDVKVLNGLDLFANLGLVCLMYLAGLEIDLDSLRETIKPSMTIGFLSFITPFLFVTGFSYLILDFNMQQTFLLGVALSTTSVAVVYPLMAEAGRIGSSGRMILSAAMVTDLFSMIFLSFIFSEFTWITIALVAGMVAFTLLFPHFGKRLFKYYKGNPVELEFKIILLIILGLTIASESAGVESAITAFLVGMITSQIVVGHKDLTEKFRFLVFGLFAPVFFFTVGLTLEFGMIMKNIGLFTILFLVCYIAKYVGTYVPARIYLPHKASRMGILFNSRLSFGIIAATIGYNEGLFTGDVYAPLVGVLIFAAIVSCILFKRV